MHERAVFAGLHLFNFIVMDMQSKWYVTFIALISFGSLILEINLMMRDSSLK